VLLPLHVVLLPSLAECHTACHHSLILILPPQWLIVSRKSKISTTKNCMGHDVGYDVSLGVWLGCKKIFSPFGQGNAKQ